MFYVSTVRIAYFAVTGPSVWPTLFPEAAGSLQSPVNIETSKSTNDMALKCIPLNWNYCPEVCTNIINTGFGWKVDANGGKGSGIHYLFIAIIDNTDLGRFENPFEKTTNTNKKQSKIYRVMSVMKMMGNSRFTTIT